MGFFSIESDSLVSGYKIALQTATVLGLLSLGTVLVFRQHHRRVSAFFFGFMVLLSAFDIASKLWANGFPGLTEGNLDQLGPSAWLFVLSGLGWIFRP